MPPQSIPFFNRISDALQDQSLQTALGRATTRFVGNRMGAFGVLNDPDTLRAQARAIRAHALANLDSMLERLADTVEARGGYVCWAEDAQAARQYIVDLAKARDVKLIVKSKSMASEEVHLNQALEHEQFQVVETDLGEYIIQLAGETPSHIIAPAIHKTREQVRDLFVKHLQMPVTDDIPTMTATARRALRQRFLQADMGISGVNFGVAESGAVVVVENEGNARLTTTAPRIHVAIMGIERVCESLEDLGVLLQVLARSATGQRLSVYTSIISGPRRANENDGPEEFHLVLLDNGRTRILREEYGEALMCMRCGAWLSIFPVHHSRGGHAYGGVSPGPIGAVLTPLLQPELAEVEQLPYASSLCGACQEVCPVQIAIPDMLLRLRADAVKAGKAPILERMAMAGWQQTMSNPSFFQNGGKLASLGTRLIGHKGWIGWLPPPLDAWTRSRDFPSFAEKSFTRLWEEKHMSQQPGK